MSLYQTITSWYQINKRALPWRIDQDPYKIWVSEIMLQQTRIEAVIGYYHRFISLFPNVATLAAAEDEVLLKLWQGLGYYARIKNMKKAALIIVHEYKGIFPTQYKDLLKLPGIGSYTASAIASFAYNAPYICVDGNVMRVFARIYNYSHNVMENSSKQYAETTLLKILQEDSSSFNQGMMELGETICLPQNPQCLICPCRALCLAHQQGNEFNVPVREVKTQKKPVYKTLILFQYHNTIALTKRNERLLHHTYEPFSETSIVSIEDIIQRWNILPSQIKKMGEYQHVFTHLIWYMHVYIVHLDHKLVMEGYDYYSLKDIQAKYPMAIAYYKFIEPYLSKEEV